MDPHPDREERSEAPAGGRGRVVVAVVIGAIFLAVVALHLFGGISPHNP